MSLYKESLKRRVVSTEPIISVRKLDAIIPNAETKIIFLEMLNLIYLLPIKEIIISRYQNLQLFIYNLYPNSIPKIHPKWKHF